MGRPYKFTPSSEWSKNFNKELIKYARRKKVYQHERENFSFLVHLQPYSHDDNHNFNKFNEI